MTRQTLLERLKEDFSNEDLDNKLRTKLNTLYFYQDLTVFEVITIWKSSGAVGLWERSTANWVFGTDIFNEDRAIALLENILAYK
jgi:hypothetical protein